MNKAVLLGIAVAMLTAPSFAQVIPPGSDVAGVSQATLADDFYKWILEAPNIPNNPLFDTTGALANNQPEFLGGSVFLLAGSNGGDSGIATRSFAVPEGVPLFLPIVTIADVELPASMDPNTCLGRPDADACALAFIADWTPPTPAEVKLTEGGYARIFDIFGPTASVFAPYLQLSSTLVPFCPPSADKLYGVPGGECGGSCRRATTWLSKVFSPACIR